MNDDELPESLMPAAFDQRDCCVCGEPTPVPFRTLTGDAPHFAVHERCEDEFRRLVASGGFAHLIPPETLLPPPADDSEAA